MNHPVMMRGSSKQETKKNRLRERENKPLQKYLPVFQQRNGREEETGASESREISREGGEGRDKGAERVLLVNGDLDGRGIVVRRLDFVVLAHGECVKRGVSEWVMRKKREM